MNIRKTPPAAQADWAYFLDVDGTLIDIAPTPGAAQVGRPLLDLLERLHWISGGAVALVSGRTLADLERRLGTLLLPCAGQHGLERRDAIGTPHFHAAPSEAKKAIQAALAPVLARNRGLLLEDKGLSLALHYRGAPRQAAHVHQLMGKLVEAAGPGLQLQKGKFVVEVKPSGVDKGTAIEDYLTEAPFLGRQAVFIGDDLTDEHGFEVINRLGGVSIKVGKGKTCAQYRLPHIAAVHAWLAGALKGNS